MDTKTNSITICEDSLQIQGEVNFPKFIQLIASALLAVMENARADISNEVMANAPEGSAEMVRAEVTGDIYDAVNIAMSNVLEKFAPEYVKYPDLTEAAIMKAEEEILEAAANGDKDALRIVTGKDPDVKDLTEDLVVCEDNSTPAQDVAQD